jgi:hypothetical protein
MKFVRLKYKLKLKNRTQNFSKLWSKNHFSAILKIAAKEKVARYQFHKELSKNDLFIRVGRKRGVSANPNGHAM